MNTSVIVSSYIHYNNVFKYLGLKYLLGDRLMLPLATSNDVILLPFCNVCSQRKEVKIGRSCTVTMSVLPM